MRKFWLFITVSGPVVVMAAGLIPGSALAGTAGWTIQPSPNPAGTTQAELVAVSCASASACTSVGDYTGSNGYLTLAEHWNGTSWAIQPTPNPAAVKNNILRGVSCSGTHFCAAVGSALPARAVQTALVEMWNGTKWAIQPTPFPGGPAGLDAVSCTAPDSCMAVGGFSKPGLSAQEQPLAEDWNGSAWTIVPTPNPRAENGSLLAAVSCTAASACTAGGDFDYADVNQSIFALRWNGTTWAMQKQPNPAGQNNNADNGVSCASGSACTSVGFLTNGGNVGQTLAERWTGTTWAIQPMPNPAGSGGAALDGVSCPSPLDCTAVGNSLTSSTGFTTNTLAEHWNGTSWAIQPTPNRAGGQINGLSGVACTPAGICEAVGSFWNGTRTQTLVERRSS